MIDANVVRVSGGRVNLFLKDESYNRAPDFGKAVKGTSAAKIGGPFVPSELSFPVTAPGTEGPELVHFPGNRFGVGEYLLYYDTYVSTCFGVSTLRDCAVTGACSLNCSGCVDGVSKDITNPKNVTTPSPRVSFPNMARHGSFVMLSEVELGVLQRAFPTTELQDCHGGPENKTVGEYCVPY